MQPERRKHVRILTIANFGRAILVLVVVLAAANIISEMRKPRPGEFGRLTLDSTPVTIKRPQAVTATEVQDVTPTMPSVALVDTEPAPVRQVQAAVPAPAHTDGHVTIVGGPDGIHVETTQRDVTPKLSGGIFRIEN
jgi:hypothetical protein